MRICFYYEYKNIVGGVTSLLITLIKEFKNQNVEVLLFNFKGGLIESELSKENIEINIIDIGHFDWKQLETVIQPSDVFVVFNLLEVYQRFFKVNPKLIYWDINDYLCDISKYKFGLQLKMLAKQLIKQLIKKDSLLFIDDTGIRNADEKLNLKISDPLFLPVPVAVPIQNTYLQVKRDYSNIIRLTYIARSVDWKMYPLKKLLDDIMKVNIGEGKQVHLSIVVDRVAGLENFINLENYKSKERFSIFVYENLMPSEINSFLLAHSDLNFGMGTSALEGAKLGIPTILMDFSKKEMPKNYVYNWLYNAKYYSLGRNAEKYYQPSETGLSMAELLNNYFEIEHYKNKESAKSYEYVKRNHAVANIVSALVEYAENASFRMRELKHYNLHYWYLHYKLKSLYSLLIKSK